MALPSKSTSAGTSALTEAVTPEPTVLDMPEVALDDFDPNSIPDDFEFRQERSGHLVVHHKVDELVTLIELGEVPKDALNRLSQALSPYVQPEYDEDFNVRDELIIQMKMVKAVRMSILDSSGKLKRETTVTEVKSVLDASMRLSDMLNKVNRDLINQERLQAVEAAFMDVVGEFEQDRQLEFVKVLERRMKAQKALQKA